MDTEKYNTIIRGMIRNENEIRNQRTNWFLVIQGFLIAGICQMDTISLFHGLVILIGITTSLSFWYAAWRSTQSVSFALNCWKEYIENEKYMRSESRNDYPPISLITKDILEEDYPIGIFHSREASILKRMYPENNRKLRFYKYLNKIDWAMPYRTLPVLFLVFWLLFIAYAIIYANLKNECSEPSEIWNNIQSWYNQYFNVFLNLR